MNAQATGTVKAVDFTKGSTANQPVPHSLEAEQALLGLLMLNNRLYEDVEGMVKPEYFYVPAHTAIFEGVQQLLFKGYEANPISLKEVINDTSIFGGKDEMIKLLTGLFESATRADNVQTLVSIIYTFYLQRQLLEMTGKLEQDLGSARTLDATTKLIERIEAELFKLNETGSTKELQNLRQPLVTVIEQIEEAKKHQGQLLGVNSGYKNLNKLLGGFRKSDLVILAARPSMGKTAFAVNVAYNAAEALRNGQTGGAAVGLFSLEMSSDQLAARMLSSASGIDSGQMARGEINDAELERVVQAAGELSEYPIVIDDTPGLSVSQFRSKARRMARQHNIGMLVVDYLQLMTSELHAHNRVQEISMISQTLKGVARELNVPVIALSQLSRNVESRENKRPQLSDLRESGAIEQDADVIMVLYREEYYLSKLMGADENSEENVKLKERLDKVKGLTELLISKNRKGSTKTLTFTFDGPTTTFHEFSGDVGYPDGVDA